MARSGGENTRTKGSAALMSRTVTLADIARHCQVAQSTVSLALQGAPRVNPVTRARILAAADALGYNAYSHEAARRLARHRHGRPSRTGLIAILFPQDFLELNYFAVLFHGISAELMQAGYGVLAISLPMTPGALPAVLPPSLLRGEVDAAIIYSLSEELQALLTQLPALTCPVVKFVNPQPGMSCVTADLRQGMYMATQHLLQAGHRELLYLASEAHTADMDVRRAGIRQALADAGLDPQSAYHEIPYEPKWLSPASLPGGTIADPDLYGQGASVLSYLHAHPAITGILCTNDAVAQHVWYTLRRAGYRIPTDYSLIGCDDTDPLLDAAGQNLLTTIRLPLRAMGRAAAQLAVQCVTGAAPAASPQLFPVDLVVRSTTGPVPRRG
jgi:LacI family transcriptional regulator